MVRIIITEEQRQQLLAAGGEIELCDESGRLLARATPVALPKSWMESVIPEGWKPAIPLPTDEELAQQYESEERGISTEELVKRLRGLM